MFGLPYRGWPHRTKGAQRRLPFNACIARPVGRQEVEKTLKAKEARDKEWDNLRKAGVWKDEDVREWDAVISESREHKRKTGEDTQFGWVFGICVEKTTSSRTGMHDTNTNTASFSKGIVL